MVRAVAARFAFVIAAYSSATLAGTWPSGGPLIGDTTIRLTPGYSIAVEKLFYWGGVAAVAYYVTDPLAPNWEIREAAFPSDHVTLSLQMKRYYVGGAGEAREVFRRRADELMRRGGFEGYQIVEYSEGLESSVIGSRRVASGTIALMRSTAR